MEELNSVNNKKKRLKIYYTLLISVICIIGVSFAWFRLYLSQSEDNTLSSRTCFSTTLTEDTEKITLTNAFPLTNEDGLKLTPFTFTIKNNCDSYVKAYITIDSEYRTSTSSSYLLDNYIKFNISNKGTTTNPSLLLSSQKLIDLDDSDKGYKILTTYLGANQEKSYDLRIWMDSEVTTSQGLSKSWEGKVVVIAEAAKEPPAAPDGWYDAGNGTILASLRDTNELEKTLTVPGEEISSYVYDDVESETSSVSSTYQSYYITYGTGWVANGTGFDLTGTAVTTDTYANSYSSLVGKYLVSYSISSAGSATAGTMMTTTKLNSVYYVVSATSSSFTYKKITSNKNTTEALLASTPDDYGTSYYYRGAVKDNYVQFANKCWRIVRITGDGSVKLVLHNDNTNGVNNPCSSANNSSTAAFARYSGTTYTSAFNSSYSDNTYVGFMYGVAGASDYASAHANINKSTILTNLESWYEKNLISYGDKLADVIWCNDKSTESDYLGYGTNYSIYSTFSRDASLICPDDNNGGKLSKFTASDTTNGNGNLEYKIGLLTADELKYAGLIVSTNPGYFSSNYSTYLSENAGGTVWWTLSPIGYDGYRVLKANGVFVAQASLYYGDTSSVTDVYGIRPAIALKSTVLMTGSGTSEDPYVVK
ncbi:MAG: hypothetical protein Q4C33_01975 [bacterium]|nr:hypothetical protein [bacterium]